MNKHRLEWSAEKKKNSEQKPFCLGLSRDNKTGATKPLGKLSSAEFQAVKLGQSLRLLTERCVGNALSAFASSFYCWESWLWTLETSINKQTGQSRRKQAHTEEQLNDRKPPHPNGLPFITHLHPSTPIAIQTESPWCDGIVSGCRRETWSSRRCSGR